MTPTTPLERAIRRMPRNRPKIIAVWLEGKIVRAQESAHLTRSGMRFNKLIRLHRRQA